MEERYGIFTQRIARISRCIRRLKAEEMALRSEGPTCLVPVLSRAGRPPDGGGAFRALR